MDTFKIKAVLLAAELRSLSKAADQFLYTPSALSHSVDSLEKELGVKLLERTHTGVQWSEDGLRLEAHLRAIMEAEEALRKSAAALGSEKQQQLRIATYSSVSVNLLPELLNGFKKQYPQIAISILVANKLSDCLDRNAADVVLGEENPDHQWLPVQKDPFLAVVPAGLFPGKKSVHCDALFPYSFIQTQNSAITRSFDVSQFHEIIHVQSDSDMAAVSMVGQGIGVTILPSLVFTGRQKGVHSLRLEPALYRTLGLSYPHGLPSDSAAMKFVGYIRSLYENGYFGAMKERIF